MPSVMIRRRCVPRRSALVLLGVLFAARSTCAQAPDTGFVHPRADEWFLQSAVGDGLAETELSALAQRVAVNAHIKTFAQRLVAIHATSNAALETFSRTKDIHVFLAFDERQESVHNRLRALSGDAFDREYLDAMIRLHEAQVDLFEHESGFGLDAEMRAWATAELPSIREHLRDARNLK